MKFSLVFDGSRGANSVFFSLYEDSEKFLTGSVSPSNGWPINSIATGAFSDDLSFSVTMTFLDANLNDVGEADDDAAASFLVIPLLTHALYYSDPKHQPKHFPVGSVWKLGSCGK